MSMSYQDIHENLLDEEESFNHEPEPLSFTKKMLVLVSVLSISGVLVLSSALHVPLRASMDHASSVSRIGGGPNMHLLKNRNRNMDKKKSGRHHDVNHHNHNHHRGRRFYLRYRTRKNKSRAGMKSQAMGTVENSQLDPDLDRPPASTSTSTSGGRKIEDDDKDDVFQGSYKKYDDEFHEPIAYTHAHTHMQTYTHEHDEKFSQDHEGHATKSQSHSSSSEIESVEQWHENTMMSDLKNIGSSDSNSDIDNDDGSKNKIVRITMKGL